MSSKLISIVTPCYNEEDNIDELCDRITHVMSNTPYNYEHILIDNASTDSTVSKIKAKGGTDTRIKLIVNARNFGHIRSPYHALLQSKGDASILIASRCGMRTRGATAPTWWTGTTRSCRSALTRGTDAD